MDLKYKRYTVAMTNLQEALDWLSVGRFSGQRYASGPNKGERVPITRENMKARLGNARRKLDELDKCIDELWPEPPKEEPKPA